jgi:hypothetical protein
MNLKSACIFLFLVLALMPAYLAGEADAQIAAKNTIISAEGVASLAENEDRVVARNKAISIAKSQAMEQLINLLVSFDQISKKAALVEKYIYSDIDKYITSYKIVSRKEYEKLYAVTMEFVFDIDLLKQDLLRLGFFAGEDRLPRLSVMFLWSEKLGGQRAVQLEQSLRGILKGKGFTIIEPRDPVASGEQDLFYNLFGTLSDKESLAGLNDKWMRSTFAPRAMSYFPSDIVLVGLLDRSVGVDNKSVKKDIQCRIVLRFMAIDTRKGRITLNHSLSVTGKDITSADKACQIAVSNIAALTAQTFLKSAYADLNRAMRNIKVYVYSLPDFATLEAIKKVFENEIEGVSEVSYHSFQAGGQATLNLKAEGNALYLIGQLRNRGFPQTRAGIQWLGEDAIKIVIIPNEPEEILETTPEIDSQP